MYTHGKSTNIFIFLCLGSQELQKWETSMTLKAWYILWAFRMVCMYVESEECNTSCRQYHTSVHVLGSILQTFISPKIFSDKLSSSKFGQKSTQKNNRVCIMGNHSYLWLWYYGILKTNKDITTNLNVTKVGFIRKFRPRWFHKIDSSSIFSML
jgi:hypothetical protein